MITRRALRAPGDVGLIVTAKDADAPGATVDGPPDVTAKAPSASPAIATCATVIGSLRMLVISIVRVALVPSPTVPKSIWLTDDVIQLTMGSGVGAGVVSGGVVSAGGVTTGGVVVAGGVPVPVFDGGGAVTGSLPGDVTVPPPLFGEVVESPEDAGGVAGCCAAPDVSVAVFWFAITAAAWSSVNVMPSSASFAFSSSSWAFAAAAAALSAVTGGAVAVVAIVPFGSVCM